MWTGVLTDGARTGRSAVVRPSASDDVRTRYRHNVHDPVEAGEVVGVGRVERQPLSRCHGCDHQVGDPTARRVPRVLDRRADPAEGSSCLRVECDGVELVLRTLQDVGTPGPLSARLRVVTRTKWTPADNSARVTALIASPSGSDSGAIHRRRIKPFVSSRPRRRSAGIGVGRTLVVRRLLVSSERREVDSWCGA